MTEMNQTPEAQGGSELSKSPQNETQQNTSGNTGAQQSGGAGQPTSAPQQEINRDARMWAMFCHLAGLGGLLPIVPIIGSIIAPLIIWQIKKDDFPFTDEQGKEAVNFQISILIYALGAGLLCLACIGFVLLPAVYVFDLIFLIIAAVKANNGQHYRYPLTIRFIK
jgi:uncharacterized Tic20 family protein